MSRPLKYGEPTVDIHIRVPQSRKEEIRELVRERLNGNDGWIKFPKERHLYPNVHAVYYLYCRRTDRVDVFTGNLLAFGGEYTHYMPITKPQPPKSK